jgi:hypothetical protein
MTYNVNINHDLDFYSVCKSYYKKIIEEEWRIFT